MPAGLFGEGYMTQFYGKVGAFLFPLALREMGKKPADDQLPTKLQGFTGAMEQNIFNTGLQVLFGCVELIHFCTSSPFEANSTATPQGSPRPPQLQQHHQEMHSHEINTHNNLIIHQISLLGYSA